MEHFEETTSTERCLSAQMTGCSALIDFISAHHNNANLVNPQTLQDSPWGLEDYMKQLP